MSIGNRLFTFIIFTFIFVNMVFADVTINPNLLVQLDDVIYSGKNKREDDGTNVFASGAAFRRANLVLQGNLGKFNDGKLSYFTQINLPTFAGPKVDQAYIKYSYDDFVLQLGQMYVPFGLENSTSASVSTFMEPSFMSSVGGGGLSFITKNNFGIMFGVSNDMYSISFGAVVPELNKEPKGRRSDNLSYVFRSILTPMNGSDGTIHFAFNFRNEKLDLLNDDGTESNYINFGVRPELRGRSSSTPATHQLIQTDEHSASDYKVYGFEFGGKYQGFTLQNEVLWNRVAWEFGDHGKYFGWYSQIAYILTGEERSYNSVKGFFGDPKVTNEFGAFELAFRYSGISMAKPEADDYPNIGKANALTFGLNWFLNNNVKLQLNYVNTTYKFMDISKDNRTVNGMGFRIQFTA